MVSVSLLLILVLTPSTAQSTRAQAACSSARLDQVDTRFKKRKASNEALRDAEQALGTLLRSCPGIPRRDELQAQLKLVQEESALLHFQIAQYYLSGLADGKGFKQGALSRLKRIYDGYPNFSRRDEALYMLGHLNAQLGDDEEAAKVFRSLIAEFPESKYSKLAQEWLKEKPGDFLS